MFGHCFLLASTPVRAHVMTQTSGSRPLVRLGSPVNNGFSCMGLSLSGLCCQGIRPALGSYHGADMTLELVHDPEQIAQIRLREAEQRAAEDFHRLDLDL